MSNELDRAKELLDRGRADEACGLLLETLKQHPDDVEMRMLLGIGEFRLKRFDAAEETFRQVIARKPDHYKAVYYLGLALERQNRKEEALPLFRASVSLRPDFAKAKEKLEQYGIATAGQQQEKRSLSALIEHGATAPRRGENLPGKLLISGRRHLSSFAGHFLIAVLLFGILAFSSYMFTSDRVAYQNGLSPQMQNLKREVLELNKRKQILGEELRRAETAGAPLPDRTRIEMELRRVELNLQAKEAEYNRLLSEMDLRQGIRSALQRAKFFSAGVTGVVTLLLLTLLLAHLGLAYVGTHYDLYERRIDIRSGGLFRKLESIWHYEIVDVTFHRSPLMTLTGNAAISLKTQEGERRIVGLASPSVMERLWREIRDAVLIERREMKKVWI